MKIYADNAATTKLDAEAFEAMKPWLLDEYANASQSYSFSRKPKVVLNQARELIAACINAEPQEIFFTSGGTESDNWAIKSSALANLNERPNIITSAIEHKAVLNSCAAMKNLGCSVTILPVDNFGTVNPADLQEKIFLQTKIISVMLANNAVGTIQPIKTLADIAHASGKIFHTDAVQAVGHIPVDVKLLPYIDGGSQEFSRRAGTENIASIVGMAVALKKNIDALDKNREHVKNLEQLFMRELERNHIPHTRNGSEHSLPGLISLSFDGLDGEAIFHRLDLMGISISTGSACDSKKIQVSHVLKALHLSESRAKGTIRISLGKDNTSEDVHAIVAALKKCFRD